MSDKIRTYRKIRAVTTTFYLDIFKSKHTGRHILKFVHLFRMVHTVYVTQYLQASKITHTLSISATFGGIFGLCMGGSIMSLFEIFYHLLLVMIAMVKTLLNQHIQQPRDNVVLPSNIKTFSPHNTELLFHRMRHEHI